MVYYYYYTIIILGVRGGAVGRKVAGSIPDAIAGIFIDLMLPASEYQGYLLGGKDV
jgi:hypothetical protein